MTMLLWLSLTIVCLPVLCQGELDVTVLAGDNKVDISVLVGNSTWLRPADLFFQRDGKRYSSADKSLQPDSLTKSVGHDSLGEFVAARWEECFSSGGCDVNLSVRRYLQLPVAIFSQVM